MTMTTTFSHRLSSLILGCAASLVLMAGATPSHAQSVAVMVNGDVVRKGSFDSVSLSDGDRVELIVIAAGG